MGAPILVVRHPVIQPRFYDVVIDWAREHAPECVALMEVRDLPLGEVGPDVRVLVPWLQDPVQAWSPQTYDHMSRVIALCDKRGIPVVNRVERLTFAGKVVAAGLIGSVGLRTPRMALVTDPASFRRDFHGLALPMFIREDWAHGGAMVRADTPEEARAIPFGAFKRPAAVQIVDVRDPADGLHYKYRYLACGEIGVSHHLQASEHWITRGENRVLNDTTRARELEYISRQDPLHERFQAARRVLGLDFAAFDYGYAPDGAAVVWEVNPFPRIQFGRSTTAYRNHAVHRSVAAMLKMYLDLAGAAASPKLEAALAL